jgi:hypothetical protein
MSLEAFAVEFSQCRSIGGELKGPHFQTTAWPVPFEDSFLARLDSPCRGLPTAGQNQTVDISKHVVLPIELSWSHTARG